MTDFQASLLDLAEEPAPGPLGATVHRTILSHGTAGRHPTAAPAGSAAGDRLLEAAPASSAAGGRLLEAAPAGSAAGGRLLEAAPASSAAWLDLRRGWLRGADVLFQKLLAAVPWRAERRQMYDRVVDVPRLLCFYDEDQPLPDPALVAARDALDAHYGAELGERFRTAGLCLYRDGRDSVAWHGDTIGRGSTEDTMVAIISLGAPRALALRPRPGSGAAGRPVRYELGHGDLVVMGGSCQRTWEHAVPKTARPTGPRISIQFRPRGVR